MRESTATTTTRRSPGGTAGVRGTAGSRGAAGRGAAGRAAQPEFNTQGATALAPDHEPRTDLGRGLGDRTDQDRKARLRVAPPVPVSAPRAPFVALVLGVVVAGVLGILVLNTKINENAFRLANLQSQQNTLDEQEQQLKAQLAEESSPTSLAAAARKLGLVPAGLPAFIRLPDGRTIGVPQPATGTPSVTGQQAASANAAGH
jgi:hypothetical protein